MTMAQDAYAAQSGGEYHIRSLYFDDPDDSAIRDKLDGLDTRDKIRIRIYNGSDRTIKLERKRKDGAYVQKSSQRLTRQECDALLRGDCRFLLGRPEPFAGQMFGILKLRQLRPRVLSITTGSRTCSRRRTCASRSTRTCARRCAPPRCSTRTCRPTR